jgi:hypothetical protein
MAIIESLTGTAMAVDPVFGAARVTVRPPDVLGWLSVGAQSGALTGVAANGPVFSFRNISANPVLIRRVGLGFVTTTAFTAPQTLSWGLFFARAFTASDTGQTAIALTGNNSKHRTALGTLTSVDCRISNAGALGVGTRTLDANSLAVAATYAGAVGAGLTPTLSNLLSQDTGDYPLVLAQNEGIVIANLTAMGAGGVGSLFVNLELAETSSY